MSNVTKMHAKLGQAMASGPGAPEQADIPNAVRHRHSLPAQIDMIEVEDRLRSVDEAAVQYIAESMQQQGQLYPNTDQDYRARPVPSDRRRPPPCRCPQARLDAYRGIPGR